MDACTNFVIPPNVGKDHHIFFTNIHIGIFKKTISLFWGDNSSTAREVSGLTPEQLKSLLSEKDLWVIFDQKGRAIGISKKHLTP